MILSRGEQALSTLIPHLVPFFPIGVEREHFYDCIAALKGMSSHYRKIPIQVIPSIPDPKILIDTDNSLYYQVSCDPNVIAVRCDAYCTLARTLDEWLIRAAPSAAAFVSVTDGNNMTTEQILFRERDIQMRRWHELSWAWLGLDRGQIYLF